MRTLSQATAASRAIKRIPGTPGNLAAHEPLTLAGSWQRLLEAGRAYGITPYGTETMHVLRAEKGYLIVGQDTDGTVTPQDLGLGWAVCKKKPDFAGKRSFARAANQDPLRKQLVGLLPVDRQTVLPEGSQIVEFCADGQLPPPPVPMLGHVTSSYRSAELGRPFALALVKGGRSRIGDTLHVPVHDALVPVEVAGSVLVTRKEPAAMAELLRTHPLQAWNAAFERLPGSVGIAVEPFVAMVDIRLGAEAAARLDVDLPAVPSTWMPVGAGRAVWLGPDEWLLTSTTEAPDELEALVRAVVLPLGGAAADVSAHRIGLRLTGPRVRDVLAKGCAIDLYPRVFRRGSSAQTMLGLAGIILLALSDAGDDYVVLVRSSFAGYLADWLLDAALEFTASGDDEGY